MSKGAKGSGKGPRRPTPMTPKDASRIQSVTDRRGSDQGFKRRAQRAGERNSGSSASGKDK